MHSNGDAEVGMDLSQLRRRQVESLSKALSQFVSLKSSPTNWTPVLHTHSSLGGDVDVQVDKRTEYNNGRSNDVYRMTASIPLDPEVSRDTQGPYSAYLSELRDWQSVLECPGIRSQWNYYLSSSRTLEMLDAHTSITRSMLKSPIPGGVKELAHQRELLMVETSLVDPTTVVYVSTSLPTTPDDPAYLRSLSGTKRVQSDIWAWCVEIATPLDAMQQHQQGVSGRASVGTPTTLHRTPRVHVQVTCFMHLELGSWKSYNALACNAASQLIPSLVAHLRLHGAPPRLARAGPSISIDRKDWWARRNKNENRSVEGDLPTWEISFSVMADSSNSNTNGQHPQSRSASGSSMAVSDHPIISRIMDLENDHAQPAVPGSGSLVHSRNEIPAHIRKMSSLTYYLSNSMQRRRGELASALGTHGGGILRDGEDLTLVTTRARLGNCILEFIVDASHWHKEGHSVDVQVNTAGFANIGQLYSSIDKVQMAAPELFTKTQLELTFGEFIDSNSSGERDIRRGTSIGGTTGDRGRGGIGAAKRASWERLMMSRLAGQQLVRCYSISSQKNGRYRYLVRIMNPPSLVPASTDTTIPDGVGGSFASGMSVNTAGTSSIANSLEPPATPSENSASVYSVSVCVRKGKKAGPKLLVNGSEMEISPFSLDPVVGSSSRPKPIRNPIATTRSWFGGNGIASSTNSPSPKPLPAPRGVMANNSGNQLVPPAMSAATGRAADGIATPALDTGNTNAVYNSASRGANVLKDQDTPSIRLHQVDSLPPSQWSVMGTMASGTIALSRAVVVSKPVVPDNTEQQQTTIATNATDGDESDESIVDKHGISGVVLRAEATVEGWTIFDVFSILSSTNEQTTKSVSGLWSESRMAEQVTDTSALYHYRTPGTWATAVREASVCRTWNTSRKRGHIEIAECSLGNESTNNPANGGNKGTAMVRADLGLAAWVLDKSTMASAQPQMYSNGNGAQNPAESVSNGEEVTTRPAEMQEERLRNRSITTGSPAIDAEFENQRRKQQVVKITHYLQYNPQGWLSAGDSINQALNLGNTNGSMRLWPEILPTGVTLAMSRNITRMVRHLDENGAPPAIVWSRNASLVNNRMEDGDGTAAAAHFKYRLSKTASSDTSAEYVEVEIRVEHRVWAYGSRADGTERTTPAVVELTVEPFYGNSSIACFVDPGIDPHATRIRIRHHRSQLLSRIVETDDADEMASGISVAWPTISVVVSRKPAFGALQSDRQQRSNVTTTEGASNSKRVSSLFDPHTSNLTSPNVVPALVLPWSVPPRLGVNSVAARVRYLRRDESTGALFYTRCLSVADNDIGRMERSVPSSGGLHVEQLPDPTIPTSTLQQTTRTDAAIPPSSYSTTHRLSLMSQPRMMNRSRRGSVASSSVSSRVAIDRYSVAALEESDLLRVATPQEYVGLVAEDFTRIRHEIELLDPESSRSQWMRHLLQDQDVGSEPPVWSQQKFGSHGAEYERIDECVHEEIPVTVGVDVLLGVSSSQVARLLELNRNGGGKGNKGSWDSALFVERRELEYLHDKNGNVSVGHGAVQTPPLICGRRDALTVARCEMTPFLPTRQRLRNWQQKNRQASSIDGDKCSNIWGDYFEPTFTLVETSVPGSVPLTTMTRASVPLYAIRVDPIDAYGRLLEADNSAYSRYRTVCRVTVASCVDLGGSVPLAIRRAVSARIPGQLIAQLRSLMPETLKNGCPLLCWPYMTVPRQTPLALSRTTSTTDVTEFVATETIEEAIDGCQTLFVRQLNSSPTTMAQAPREYLLGSEDNNCYYRGEVAIHPGLYSQLGKRVCAYAEAVDCLRKDATQSEADSMPKLGASANISRNVNTAIPIISEVVVDGTWCKGKGISVLVSTAGNKQQLRQQNVNNIPSGVWISSWRCTTNGSRLGVYVFTREGEYVVRVVMFPPSEEDINRAEEEEERLAGNAADNNDGDIMRHHQTDRVIIEIRVGDKYHSMREAFLSSAATVTATADQREIRCNGQRLRTHPSQAARHSLVSVETTEGRILDACQECGDIGCKRVVADADERREMVYGSDCDNSQMLSVSSDNSEQSASGNVTILQGERRRLQQTGAVVTANSSNVSSFPQMPAMLLRQRTNRHFSPAAADRLDNSDSSGIANYKSTATVDNGTYFNGKHPNDGSAQITRKSSPAMMALVLGIGLFGIILGRALASVVYS